MSLSLKEKQFFRSLVDLSVQNPVSAKELFKNAMSDYINSRLGVIQPLITFVINNLPPNSEDRSLEPTPNYYMDYISRLKECASEINDQEIQWMIRDSVDAQSEKQKTDCYNKY